MGYTNSNLIAYTQISPNRNAPRNHAIDTVSIHCYVGQASVESAGNWFAKSSTSASCNYYIGSDGRVALIVPESDRSWCTSSSSNDNRAITIECASDKITPYRVNDVVYNKLIELLADICTRNNIKELRWQGDKSLIGQVDKQNMTVHRWFKNKACPGDYLYNRHGDIAYKVNLKLKESLMQPKWFGIVNTESLNMRSDAGTAYGKLAVLGKGAEVVVYDSKTGTDGDKWFYVSYNGIYGYVHSSFIGKMGMSSGGFDYSIVFDPVYYVNKYSDLKKAFGYNGLQLFDHWLEYGMKEGRQGVATFNVTAYKSRYADLRKAFGSDLVKYYQHYITYGRKEGRKAV